HESKAVEELLSKISRKGFSVEHYSAQDQPLFEVVEGEGEKAQVKPIFSIAEILSSIKEVGRRGIQIKRFKGLGEMNAKELFESPTKSRIHFSTTRCRSSFRGRCRTCGMV